LTSIKSEEQIKIMHGLKIEQAVLNKIEKHGERAFPEECIGAVLGELPENGARQAADIIAFENASEDNRRRRSLVTPQDYLRADTEAQARKLEVIGWYHSHPNVAAIPSQFDLENALPWYSYLIVSIRDGKAAELRSWRLAEDRSQFWEEEINMMRDS